MYAYGCTIFQSIHEVDTFIVNCQLSIVNYLMAYSIFATWALVTVP